MEIAYIAIAIAAYVLILGFLYIARVKGKQPSKPSTLTTISLSLVLVGFIFGNGNSWYGYSIMGAGVILALVILARSLLR
jgi:peptidoglycan/LPS O-acetylase OafA/YrhL